MKPTILSVFVGAASIAIAACSSDGTGGDGGDEGASGEGGESGSGTGGSSTGGSAGAMGGGDSGGSGSAGSSGSSGNGGSGQSGSGGAPGGPGCDHPPAVEACDERGFDPPGGCTEHYNEGFVPNQMCPVTGGQQGEYVDGPCPTEGALGYCNYNQFDGAIRFGLYSYNEDSVSIEMAVCTSGGGSWCEI
jgi:hypothetical protein